MSEPLDVALAEVRTLLLGPDLVRAVAAGRRRGQAPSVVRAELRPVALKAGARLQIVASDGARPHTRNVAPGREAATAVDALLAEPFGNWHVRTVGQVLQLRVTKKGLAQVHREVATARQPSQPGQPAGIIEPADALADSAALADSDVVACSDVVAEPLAGRTAGRHDRAKEHLLDPDDPLFTAIGASAAKRRQVEAFLRALAATLPDPPARLRVVDLGCGNAYLTFAAYRYLTGRGVTVDMVGVDVREDQRRRNTELAERLGYAERLRFVAGTILDAVPFPATARAGESDAGEDAGESDAGDNTAGEDAAPDLVLALHACDTATDQALARAVRWRARWVLAAPCCHHDVAAQLRRQPAPAPYQVLTRHGILRERFADALTDALRACLLRLHGYQVDVVEFVDSAHTPRNLLLRARRTDAPPTAEQRHEYATLVDGWRITPALHRLLAVNSPPS